MRLRRLTAGAAALWTVAYVCGYVALISQQGDSSVAWWYVGLLAVAVAVFAGGTAGRAGTAALIGGAVLLGLAALLGLASIGMLLLPAVAAGGLAAGAGPPGTDTDADRAAAGPDPGDVSPQ